MEYLKKLTKEKQGRWIFIAIRETLMADNAKLAYSGIKNIFVPIL